MNQRVRQRPLAIGPLRAFEAVARLLSFRAAGEELHLTQSAVSRQIQSLEEEIGIALFTRGTRQVALTVAGASLLRAAVPALGKLDAAVQQLRRTSVRPRVSITTFASFASLWLIPRLEGFQRDHPGLDIRINAEDALHDLDDPDIDLALRHCSAEVVPPEAQRLFGECVSPVVSPWLIERSARGDAPPLGAPAAPARSVTTDRAAASQPPVQSQAAARVSAQIDAGYRAPALPDDPSGFAPTNLLPLRPMPDVRARPVPMQDEVLEVYVHQVCELNGVVGCCVFDIGSGLPVAHGGAGAPPEELARHGRALLSAMGTTSRALGLGHTLPDAAITLGSHHLLLRSVAKHAGMALLTVLDRTNANLTLARLQIERLDPLLDR